MGRFRASYAGSLRTARARYEQDRLPVLGLLAILVAGFAGARLVHGLQAVTFPDTETYVATKRLLASGDWAATRTAFRGQTFPLAWLVAEKLKIAFPLLAAILSTVCSGALFVVAGRYSRRLSLLLAVMLPLYLVNRDHLGWLTTYLTESLQFGLIALMFAAVLALETGLGNGRRSARAGTPAMVAAAVFAIGVVVTIHSLKPWLVIVPLGYAAARGLLAVATGAFARSPGRVGRLDVPAVVVCGVLLLGALCGRIFYTEAYSRSPGAANAIAFLVRERADLFLARRIAELPGGSSRRRQLEEIQAQIAAGIVGCVDKGWACDLAWSGTGPGGPQKDGTDRPVRLIRTIYLGDRAGVEEITRISLRRLTTNLALGQSLKAVYGGQAGLNLYRYLSPVAGLIWMLGLIAAAGSFLALVSTRLWRRPAGFLRRAAAPLARPGVQVALSFCVATAVLFVFLSITGAYEYARTEAPAVYGVLLSAALVLAECPATGPRPV